MEMTTSPVSARLRDALGWWRAAAELKGPPDEADFVSQDPHAYALLLADAFIVDIAPEGDLAYRYVGTELADYLGLSAPGQRLDLTRSRRDSDLIRDVLSRTDATQSPQLARGRITAASASGSGPLEVMCLPLTTSAGGAAFFGAAARDGLRKLPPAPLVRRIEIVSVEDL
jgi:hypothetical protein